MLLFVVEATCAVQQNGQTLLVAFASMNLRGICSKQFLSSLQLNEWDAEAREWEIPPRSQQAPAWWGAEGRHRQPGLAQQPSPAWDTSQPESEAQYHKPSDRQQCFSSYHHKAPQNTGTSLWRHKKMLLIKHYIFSLRLFSKTDLGIKIEI